MKLQSRKNGTVVITCNAATVDQLRYAIGTLEHHHWEVARGEPEGTSAEKLERDGAHAAQRLAYEFERFASAAAAGRVEAVEMTDHEPGAYKYSFNYVNL